MRSLVRCAKAIDSLEGESLACPRPVRAAAPSRVASAMARFIFMMRIGKLLVFELVIWIAHVRHSPASGPVGKRPSGGCRVNGAEVGSQNPVPVSLPG